MKYRRLSEYMETQPESGVVTKAGEPRKLLAELRGLSTEITRLENALGITAAVRAALGVNIAKGLDLAEQMSERRGNR